MSAPMVMERVWTNKSTYNDAEKKYYEVRMNYIKDRILFLKLFRTLNDRKEIILYDIYLVCNLFVNKFVSSY